VEYLLLLVGLSPLFLVLGNITSSFLDGVLRRIPGWLVNDDINNAAAIARSKLALDSNKPYTVNLTDLRVFDAFQTNLPGTAASDDLALIGGTVGTHGPVIRTSDAKATTVTQKARFLVRIPAEYVAAETITLRLHCGMNTTASDGTATVDVEAYQSDLEGGVSADLCATAAQSINDLTDADKDFVITSSSLEAGDVLDVLITVAITDAASGTAVIGQIGGITLLADVKG